MMTLVYIHGFNSSSASVKGRLLQQAVQMRGQGVQMVAPDLPFEPVKAINLLQHVVEKALAETPVMLVGSSLGGYYATYLAERCGTKAVVVNPAVRPYELLYKYLGVQRNIYTDEEYALTAAHIDQLKALEVQPITGSERYLLMLQTGDEVLDFRQAIAKYRGCPQIMIEGGDHGFQNFSDYIERILAFGQRPSSTQV